MFLEIERLLTVEEIARLTRLASEIRFVDGRATNPANVTKNNLQAESSDPLSAESSGIVAAAFLRSSEFRDFAFPHVIANPLLARYIPGMQYGVHADAPFLPVGPAPLRSDISATVFIASPESYEGGELVIHLGGRGLPFKGQAGAAIVYPSTTLHEVRPVTSGVRLVAIAFIQSQVPDETCRNLLYELNEVAALEGLNMRWENRVRLEAVRYNLMRRWSTG